MSPAPLSPETPPVLSRAMFALALYTFAAWLVIGTALLVWVPGRGAAAGVVSRLSSVLSSASSSAAIAPIALGEVFLASTDEDNAVYGARMGRISGRLGAASARIAILQARAARHAARDRDRANVDERMKALRAEIAELSAQLDKEHASQGSQQQELSRRISELSAKHHDMLQQVRQKVREIATRARREGKAERPHANA